MTDATETEKVETEDEYADVRTLLRERVPSPRRRVDVEVAGAVDVHELLAAHSEAVGGPLCRHGHSCTCLNSSGSARRTVRRAPMSDTTTSSTSSQPSQVASAARSSASHQARPQGPQRR